MKKIILIFLVIITIGIAGIAFKISRNSKIAYVRSADLIYNYQGMKEAQGKQQKKTEELKSNLDTLQVNFQKAISHYNIAFPKLSKEERLEQEKTLTIQQNQLKNYSQTIEQTIKKQDEKLTEGVLNQVNAFIEEYARKEGYDLVLGTTTAGNILFARGDMDITDAVLVALNAQFKKNPN